jgi:hypothetical protein
VYLIDRDWGPAFIKICGYAPYAVKVCLNGHEWAKRQASRRRIGYEALDHGFLACTDPAALQQVCASLNADDIQDCFERWLACLPLPLTMTDRLAGFRYQLSLLQMEVSHTQVLDDPLRGREFFEEVIRDNLDLGRPDRIQLLVDSAGPNQYSRSVPDTCHHRRNRAQPARRVQALPHQTVLERGARFAHRDHLQ